MYIKSQNEKTNVYLKVRYRVHVHKKREMKQLRKIIQL